MLEVDQLKTMHVGPITVKVADGECVAVLGPSGSGKSLLLRAIADLDPNEGSIQLNGQSRELMPAYEWRRRVSFVPAETGWWADRVRDHYTDADDMSDLLGAVKMTDAMDWEVSRLSTGERHRLAIVRALQSKPQALLLDEPTASLDADMTKAIEELIRQQLAQGVCVLMVTHDEDQARRIASRSMRMSAGQLTPEARAKS